MGNPRPAPDSSPFAGGKRPHVLFVAGKDWLGLSRLPKVLAGADCRVTLFGLRDSIISRSHYVHRRLYAPGGFPQFIDALRAHLGEHRGEYDWILIADEPTFMSLARRAREGWLDGWFPVAPRSAAVGVLTSKVAFVHACLDRGIPVPQTRFCWNTEQALMATRGIGYPVIVKGAIGSSGSRVKRADSPAELAEIYRQFTGDEAVLQQFVDGDIGVCEALLDHGRPVTWASSYKSLVWPAPFGPAAERLYSTEPQADAILRQLGEATGFHGFCGFDWIKERSSGRILVIEFHPRPTPSPHVGHLGGAKFVAGVHAMFHDPSLDCRPGRVSSPGPRLLMFPQHLYRSLDERDWRGLLRWLPFCSIKDIPWDDPNLMLRFIPKLLGRGGTLLLRLMGRDMPAPPAPAPRSVPLKPRPVAA